MRRIAILASGTGSNARKIVEHLKDSEHIEVALIASNKSKAKVLDMAKDHEIPTCVISRDDFYHNGTFAERLKNENIGWIILAGFLWLVPEDLVKQYPNRIVNIHPALLPQYGGKGMYGMNVHRAVKEAQEAQSGMTIHLVNEKYDDGEYLFQASVDLNRDDTAEDIASKVLQLEHQYYPTVVEGWVMSSEE